MSPSAPSSLAAATPLSITPPPNHPDPLPDSRPDPRAPLPAIWAGSIATRFARQAKLQPKAPALITTRGDWSYAELDLQTDRLANALRAQGLGLGAVVAIHGRRSPALALAILGVMKAQAAFVLLDPAHPLLWRQQQLDLAQPQGWLHLQSPNEAEVPLPPAGCVGFAIPATELHPTGLLFADAPAPPAQAPTEPDDVAYLAFTSGTTGAPRGIIGTHRPLSHFLAWHIDTFGLTHTDRFVLTAGIGHDLFLRELFSPWWCGGAVFIPGRDVASDPEAVAACLGERGITVAHFTPSMARLLCQSATAPWPSLRYACLAGEPLHYTDVDTLRSQAPAVKCVNFYGATETPQAMGHHFIGATSADDNIVPVGRGIEGVQLLVLTAEGRLAEVGEEGEIHVRTPYLSRGYLNDPERTRQRFEVNPWTGTADDLLFRTGDLGRYLPDGNVAIAGRRDDEVKVRGFRVSPAGVEAVLAAHPGLAGAAVIAPPDADGSARLIAYFVARPDALVESGDLLKYLRKRLPKAMLPALLIPLERLPLNPRGKLDRNALPLPVEAASARVDEPKSPLEISLAALWRELLGRPAIGIHENFFDLGGHSLVATRLRSRIQRLGFSVRLRDIFDHPTISALAAQLGSRGTPGTPLEIPSSAGAQPATPALTSTPFSATPAPALVAPIATTAAETVDAVKARYTCPTKPSPWFSRRACDLIVVINERFNPEGFEGLVAYVRALDPSITVSLVKDEPGARLPASTGPTLVVAPALIRQASLRRGKVLCGFPFSKSEEYERLEAAGFPLPRWAVLAEDSEPDLRAFGDPVVRKPNYGGRGTDVRLVSKEKLRWKPLQTPLGGTSPTTIIQDFVWTGPVAVSYRVNCLCGQALYCIRHEANPDRPRIDSPASPAASQARDGFTIVATALDSRVTFCHDPEMIALAEAACRVFPDVPLLGFDLVRELPSGKLYFLETNPIGYVWNFDQAQYRDFGLVLEAQFDGLRKAAYILAERTQQLAE